MPSGEPLPRRRKRLAHNVLKQRNRWQWVTLIACGGHATALFFGIAGGVRCGLFRTFLLVPTLCVGTAPRTLCVLVRGSARSSRDREAAGVKAIVEKVRQALPHTKVLLLGIFPRGPNANDGNRKKNIAANKIIKKLHDRKMIVYLDISARFLRPDGTLSKEIMHDHLHLTERGYQIWAESIDARLAKLMGEKKTPKRRR
ncbi:MAG TPA: GDSL-type esterase/lipase family protein [Pirellulales bacterium]|nr:GDSL-type esterase/lipase family protein [Pirellulales bacterium]